MFRCVIPGRGSTCPGWRHTTRSVGSRCGTRSRPPIRTCLAFPPRRRWWPTAGSRLGMPGLVHVRNRIVQHRPVDAGEPLTLRSSARALRPHEKGAQIDLVGEVRVGDELVWEGVSTYLSRGASVPGETAPAQHVAVDLGPDAPANAVWDVPGDMGRRYAAVSGDVDPMHLSSLAARAFGFPGALVQGMWTKAHALAAIEARLPDAYVVDVDFSEP